MALTASDREQMTLRLLEQHVEALNHRTMLMQAIEQVVRGENWAAAMEQLWRVYEAVDVSMHGLRPRVHLEHCPTGEACLILAMCGLKTGRNGASRCPTCPEEEV